MEAFSLLKYWRGGGGLPCPSPSPSPVVSASNPVGGSLDSVVATTRHSATTTTIVASAFPDDDNAAAPPPSTDDSDDDDGGGGGGDDGPFFDLEFAVGGEEQRKEGDSYSDSDLDSGSDSDGGDGRELNFTLSSVSSCNDDTNQLTLSPSDEMFIKGTLVPMMESSSSSASSDEDAMMMNPKSLKIPVSLLKSATKFRVFLLGFKKSKEKSAGELKDGDSAAAAEPEQKEEDGGKENGKQGGGKLFTVKFKVEEVPIVSLFTRDSSKSGGGKQSGGGISENPGDAAAATAEERQRFSKEALQKYLKKVKPLYVRVSKRYGEKLGFSGQLSLGSTVGVPSAAAPAILKASPSKSEKSEKIQQDSGEGQQETATTTVKGAAKQGNLQAGLRVMCKHLGKSRSASSAVAAAPSPTAAAAGSNRRDDSLLQQQDGIQSAILHCKRSFNASRDSEYARSASDSASSPTGKDSGGGDDGKAASGSGPV